MNTLNLRMKRILSIGLAIVLALLVTACGNSASKEEENIRSLVDNTMNVFLHPTNEELSKYVDDSELSQLTELGLDPADFFQHAFKYLTYSIDKVTIDGDKALVAMTVSNVSLSDAMAAASEEFTAWTNTDEAVDVYQKDGQQGLYNKLFTMLYAQIDKLSETNLVTTQTTMYLQKQEDGSWDTTEGTDNNDFYSALYGGSDFADSLG
ncbi:MAG: hypothetical protein IKE22_03155 [Atopobiaceae bacterium]|nr:hypothetical protein [Atopobiaceae bacterium]